MVKKVATKKAGAKAQKRDDNQLAAAIRDSAQQIWLAGMGAFAKARAERTKIFDALVKEGHNIQLRTRALAEDRIGEVSERVNDVKERASESWDKLEQVFENRVSRALGRLGVPTSKDIKALAKRVDALSASVQALGAKAPAKAPAARKAAARKAAAKPAKAARSAAKRARKAPAKAAAGPTASAAPAERASA
jgi:poly(hydroxyalkanoate) granule-associated protein